MDYYEEMKDSFVIQITEEQRRKYSKEANVLRCWEWAMTQFGPPGYNQRWHWDTSLTFKFRDREDAILFALKWGE